MSEFLEKLAREHGIPYRFSNVPEGRRSYLMGGIVILDENLTAERSHWAYCHEIAHLLLNHTKTTPADPSEEFRQEQEANLYAAHLMLPAEQFKPRVHLSLTELKALFPHASYEVIARRRLQYRPGLLTIFDNQRLTARVAPDGWRRPETLYPAEQRALKACLTSKSEVGIEDDYLSVEATYVDENKGVIRVILFVEEK